MASSLHAFLITAVAFLEIVQVHAQKTTLRPQGIPYARPPDYNPYTVPNISSAGEPVLESFVSFSIESAFFPDYAGNKSHANTFSNNLLESLAEYQGSKPHIRVGGNTQDYALFSPTLGIATLGTYTNVSSDYPRILTIGPSYFESYTTFPNTRFIHGLNLAKNDTDSNVTQSIVDSIPFACEALDTGNFLAWEMGNEPDLFKTSAQGIMRPKSWDETDYVNEWAKRVELVKTTLAKSCKGNWTSAKNFQWIAPSFAGTSNSLDALKTWNAGLKNKTSIVSRFSSHNYIDGATQPGITLANTLLNHTKTALSIAAHTVEQAHLKASGLNHPYILSETNSLYNQGKPGLSNSFGAALWLLDFNLLCAATNIRQVFMHMGTNYRYASWQPIDTEKSPRGTNAPFYGNVAVAAALGDLSTKGSVRVANIPLKNVEEAAYAVYANETLARVVVINMHQYNYSSDEMVGEAQQKQRPVPYYNFTVPVQCMGTASVQRLWANGSDAVTGITFDGVSYNYDIAEGRGKLLSNVTRGQSVWVGSDGGFAVDVADSSAVVVGLQC